MSDFVIVEWTDSGESDWDCVARLHMHHCDDEWHGGAIVRFDDGQIVESGICRPSLHGVAS